MEIVSFNRALQKSNRKDKKKINPPDVKNNVETIMVIFQIFVFNATSLAGI